MAERRDKLERDRRDYSDDPVLLEAGNYRKDLDFLSALNPVIITDNEVQILISIALKYDMDTVEISKDMKVFYKAKGLITREVLERLSHLSDQLIERERERRVSSAPTKSKVESSKKPKW